MAVEDTNLVWQLVEANKICHLVGLKKASASVYEKRRLKIGGGGKQKRTEPRSRSQVLSSYGDSKKKSQVSLTSGTSVASALDSNKKNPFDFWFVWCNSCNHGGHAAHVSQWFSSHSTCPVEKCKCRCSGFE